MEGEPLKHLRILALLTAMTIVVTACTGGGSSPSPDEPGATQAAEVPDEIVIGFVPSREADALVETIQPVADALEEALGIPVTGIVSTDYTALVEAMNTGQAHVGALGPFSLLQARDRAGAEIILQSERFGSATYHTQFMTNNPDKYCEDEPVVVDEETGFMNCNGTADADTGPVALDKVGEIEEGTTVAFVEEASASGYIFPATILKQQGIDYENGIEPLFAGGHDTSVVAVCEGDAEVGVAFDDARGAAETDCDVANNVVVFAYGPEIPNDGWAVAGDLPEDLKDQIKQALLDYAGTEEGQATLEAIYEITGLVEADQEAFTIVEDAAAELGIEGD